MYECYRAEERPGVPINFREPQEFSLSCVCVLVMRGELTPLLLLNWIYVHCVLIDLPYYALCSMCTEAVQSAVCICGFRGYIFLGVVLTTFKFPFAGKVFACVTLVDVTRFVLPRGRSTFCSLLRIPMLYLKNIYMAVFFFYLMSASDIRSEFLLLSSKFRKSPVSGGGRLRYSWRSTSDQQVKTNFQVFTRIHVIGKFWNFSLKNTTSPPPHKKSNKIQKPTTTNRTNSGLTSSGLRQIKPSSGRVVQQDYCHCTSM